MKQQYKDLVSTMKGKKVMIIGDLMLDHYLIGGVDRISPEAPVPVVRVEEERYLLGGAGNVARNIAELGGECLLVGMSGEDEAGGVLQSLCNEAQLPVRLFAEEGRPTTIKTRIIAHNQQVVRVDKETATPVCGKVLRKIFKYLQGAIADYPVIILSDYGKGLICREFMDGFWNMLDELPARPKVLVDPKTVNYDLYMGVDLLTPNTKEAGEGAGRHVDGSRESVLAAGDELFRRLSCNHLLITLGSNGMALFEDADSVKHVPTFAQKVYDVTGAGDTVIATLGLALAAGIDLLEAATLANYAAGITVGQVGAACATPDQILEAVDELPEPVITRWR